MDRESRDIAVYLYTLFGKDTSREIIRRKRAATKRDRDEGKVQSEEKSSSKTEKRDNRETDRGE